MKKHIAPFAYADRILSAVKSGVLLTTQENGFVNSMTISWGTIGVQWGKPIFTVFVRGCRFTKPMLDHTMEFTVNIPLGDTCKEILHLCGTKSGRDLDKIQALGLTLEKPERINVPGIKELPLTLECRVIYKQQQYPEFFADPHLHTHYPEHTEDLTADYHTAYYGEILNAYIIE